MPDTGDFAARWEIQRAEAETAEHLGGDVYATFDGQQVWVRTFEGGQGVALQPRVWKALVAFVGPGAKPE